MGNLNYHDGEYDYHRHLHKLVVNERDKIVTENIENKLKKIKSQKIAIVFGAGHMPSIYAKLKDLGFDKESKKWFTIVSYKN